MVADILLFWPTGLSANIKTPFSSPSMSDDPVDAFRCCSSALWLVLHADLALTSPPTPLITHTHASLRHWRSPPARGGAHRQPTQESACSCWQMPGVISLQTALLYFQPGSMWCLPSSPCPNWLELSWSHGEGVDDSRDHQKTYKEGNQQQAAAHCHRWDWACSPWWQVLTTQPGLCSRLGVPGSNTPPHIPRAQGSLHKGYKIQATTAFSECLFKLLQMF